MSERDAFLAAVRANPADDTVRLVFADWLDDHGEPERAEFIRVQCELEPLREKLDDSRVQALWQREDELLAEHFPRWAGSVADLGAIEPQFGPVFVRGFPERVGVSINTLLKRGDEIIAACPTVREVAVFIPERRRHSTLENRYPFESIIFCDQAWARQLVIPSVARFPLLGDLGHGLFAGRLPSGTACLAAITDNGKRVYLVTFNADGTFGKTLWEDGQWSGDRLRQRFGFVPGLIRIREFRDRGLALRLWPTQYINDYLRDPWRQPAGMAEPQWRTRGGILRKWLELGQFVVEWQGREHVADNRGRVVAVR